MLAKRGQYGAGVSVRGVLPPIVGVGEVNPKNFVKIRKWKTFTIDNISTTCYMLTMTCPHTNTSVTNTAYYGTERARGIGVPKDVPFRVARYRKCADCGETFATIEVDRDLFVETFKTIPLVRQKVLNEIQQYLLQLPQI